MFQYHQRYSSEYSNNWERIFDKKNNHREGENVICTCGRLACILKKEQLAEDQETIELSERQSS